MVSTFLSGHHRRYAPSCASPPSSSQLVGGVQKATRLAGACVALIAGEHEVNVNLVFKWRRDHWEGQLGPVAPPSRFFAGQPEPGSDAFSGGGYATAAEAGRTGRGMRLGRPSTSSRANIKAYWPLPVPSIGFPYATGAAPKGPSPPVAILPSRHCSSQISFRAPISAETGPRITYTNRQQVASLGGLAPMNHL